MFVRARRGLDMSAKGEVLFIDHEDSFVYNLVDALAAMGHDVAVFRSDWPLDVARERLRARPPSLLLLSPGPCGPRDAALSMALLQEKGGLPPIFGVCLGFQCIVEAFGGRVEATGRPMHGRASMMNHDGHALFDGVENPFAAGRYHSLAAVRMPKELAVIAEGDHLPMAVCHRTRPILGVQFHPESVLTPSGERILKNVMDWAGSFG